jgi:hypothetical protein
MAVAQARQRGAVLHAIRVWTFAFVGPGYTRERAREVEQEAFAVIDRAFDEAMGGEPEGIEVVLKTVSGSPGRS